MRLKFVAGNWKMNGSIAANTALLQAMLPLPADQLETAIFPPYVYLAAVSGLLGQGSTVLGAQDVCEYGPGAYTGEIAAAMLADLGCRYVLVGHSERRALFGDTDVRVAKKFIAAQAAGLQPVLCVGESLQERETGLAESVIARQIRTVIDRVGVHALKQAVLAYEPVWAIGTGKTASPEQAQAMHAFIRSSIAQHDREVAAGLRVVYGGSVKASNATELFAMPDIDGGLIGGAALVAAEFTAICQAAVAA